MRVFILFLLAGLCYPTQASAQQAIHKFETLNVALTEQANAVVRLTERHITYKNPKKLEVEERRVVTVLNAKGKDAVGAYLHYNDDTWRKNVEAYFYDKNGKEIKKISERDFKDASAVSDGTLYADSRVKYLSQPSLSFPYTVDFKASYKTDNTAYTPGFYFIKSYNVSVEKAVFNVTYDRNDYQIRFKEKNFRDYGITANKSPEGITYTGKNLQPIKAESYAPSLSNYAPKILVEPVDFYISGEEGEVSNWNDLGKWMNNTILKGRDALPEEVKTKMQELTKGVNDPIEKARIIYHYVQNTTRYISVQVGIGGIQPFPASEVDHLKYSDCKGLTNYTKSLLESVGVPSYYTHVKAGAQKVDFEKDFASLGQANHAILCIPNGNEVVWADCTDNRIPFGFICNFTDDRRVLAMTPTGGKLMHTLAYLNADNYQITSGEMTIDENGGLTSTAKIATGGSQYAEHFRLADLPKDELLKYDRNYWRCLKDLHIQSHDFKNDKLNGEFTETVNLSTPNFGTQFGKHLLFLANPLNKHTSVPPRYAERTTPFVIQRGYMDEDHIKIHIPENYKVEAIPETLSIESKFGNYEMRVKKIDDRTLSYYKKVLIKAGNYSKDNYTAFRDFKKKIAKNSNAKIALIKP